MLHVDKRALWTVHTARENKIDWKMKKMLNLTHNKEEANKITIQGIFFFFFAVRMAKIEKFGMYLISKAVKKQALLSFIVCRIQLRTNI